MYYSGLLQGHDLDRQSLASSPPSITKVAPVTKMLRPTQAASRASDYGNPIREL